MENILVEGIHGHGAIPKKIDFRDHKIKGLGMASSPFDWGKGFDVEELLKSKLSNPNFRVAYEDQNGSSSCGGQAARYYDEILRMLKTGHLDRRSAKFPYSQIFYVGGGTTIRDIGRICCQVGLCSESIVPSYQGNQAPSESFMEDKTGNTQTAIADAKNGREFGYAIVKTDVESIAEAVRDNNGCIIQVGGQNNGTWLTLFPKPPVSVEWRHFLYAGKAKIVNGKKCIGILNSWGNIGDNGWQWLSEDYFNGGVEDAMVFYDTQLYQYTPTNGQVVLSGIQGFFQKFMQWFNNYFPYHN